MFLERKRLASREKEERQSRRERKRYRQRYSGKGEREREREREKRPTLHLLASLGTNFRARMRSPFVFTSSSGGSV